MIKTAVQQFLEDQRGRDIRDIMIGAFEEHRGLPNMLMRVAVDLGISDVTLYSWCRQMGIDIEEYRREEP